MLTSPSRGGYQGSAAPMGSAIETSRARSRGRFLVWPLLLGLALAGLALQPRLIPKAVAASLNPIQIENQQPGSTGWQLDNYNKETRHEIEGYASLTSVNKGSAISFMVNLSASAQFTMDIYRMGYYPTGTNPDGTPCAGPCGGRLMQSVGPLNGATQPACPTTTSGSNLHMIECQWSPSYTLTIPTTWTTGNYLVKLKRLDDSLENYMTFAVRDDASTADIVYSTDVTTWQAYNFWGGAGNNNVGYNLYASFNDVTLAGLNGGRAYTVSFDRPYLDQGSTDGAGLFMVWDYPMIRWLEAQGYNVTYVTDVDLEANPNILSGHRAFVNTGHDEYVSDNMRASIQNGIAAGVNMAFFSANDLYWRMLWGSSTSGQSDRRVLCDKGASGSTMLRWRDLTPPQPENALQGIMQNGTVSSRPYMVYDATSWIYAGTGLVNYNGTTVTSGSGQNAIAGIMGPEFDQRASTNASLSTWASYEPSGIQQVGHSFVPSTDNGTATWADTTLYTASSGAIVFSAGTMQWSFGLDNAFNDGFCDCNPGYANAASQRITANLLNRFVTPTTAPAVSLSPTSLSFGSQSVGTTGAAQTVTLTNSGTAALGITGITITGTNPADFAQTNTCPASPATLAAGAACAISVTFTPATGGGRAASLSVADTASGSPQAVALSGIGLGPGVTLSPTSLSFGNQLIGSTSAAQSATLTNSGNAPLSITGIALGGTNAADFAQTNTCPASPATLAAGAACAISVTFSPSASGVRSASVQVTDNASGSPHTLGLMGTGVVPAPATSISPATLSFGAQNVGTTGAAQTVTLTNSGTATLSVSGVAMTGTNAGDFAISSDTCNGATLAVNASCTTSVTFTPTAAGLRNASLTYTDNAPNSPQNIALSGTGGAPAVSLSPTSLSFGSQSVGTTGAAQTVTLTNSGNAPLTISSIALGGANTADFAWTSACPTGSNTLAAGASCAISVTFTAGDSGARSASLVIADNASGSPQAVALSGSGLTADVAVTVSANKSTVKKGTNLNYTITVTNSGPGSAPGITMTDAIPAGATFSSASWSSGVVTCTTPPAGGTGTLTCRPNNATGTLASGASFTVTMTVTVSPSAGSSLVDTAVVAIPSTLHYDPNIANNSASLTTATR